MAQSLGLFLLSTVAFNVCMMSPPFLRAQEARKPNIVIILADDLGYGDPGCYGAKLVETPNIDRLAEQGRRFTDAHTPSSVCSPTRYGMVTGRYCWRTSLKRQVLGVASPLHIETTRMTIASLLRSLGYTTAAIGKWHLGYGNGPKTDFNRPLSPGPKNVGFDYHFGVPSNHGDLTRCYFEYEEIVDRKPGEPFELPTKGGMPKGLAKTRVDDRVDLMLTEKAINWIEKNHERPFFLYFTPVAVHNPVTPNKMFRGQSKCGIYGDYIRELDWSVGQILDILDKDKVADNTLVIFSSDNGGVVTTDKDSGEFPLNLENDAGGIVTKFYRSAQRDAYAAGHRACGILRGRKHSIFEGGNRVPFIARWSGKIPARSTCDEVIGLTDMLATIAGIHGKKLPDGAGEDSYDVGPALFGKKLDGSVRGPLVMANAEGVMAIRQGPWKLIAKGAAPGALLKSPWTREGDKAQLYNLANDLRETTDIIVRHPEIAERLGKLLDQYREQGYSRPKN